MRSTIKDLRDRFKRFLAGRVPYLQFKVLFVQTNQQRAELYPHSHFVIFNEIIRRHAVHKATFADGRVTNDDEFKQEILWRG